MYTPTKKAKSPPSLCSNDSTLQLKHQTSASSSKHANSAKASTKKRTSDSKVMTQGKTIKYQADMQMISNKQPQKFQMIPLLIAGGMKQKAYPVKAVYDLKLNKFDSRSRQHMSNQLNQSLSENQPYDSNMQLIDESQIYPYTMRGNNENDDSLYNDQPTNLITHHHQQYANQTCDEYGKVNNENEILSRRFSNSTEKFSQATLLLQKESDHNNSSCSIGMKQRRSRTQRKIMREKSSEGGYYNNEEGDNVMTIQVKEEEMIEPNLVNKEECQLLRSKSSARMNDANTVDEFAKSLLQSSFVLNEESPQKDDQKNESNNDYINKILDIYYPKAGNIQDQQPSQHQEPVQENPQLEQSPPTECALKAKIQLYSTEESELESQKQAPKQQLNEDINMQLYGQISMFDQLTDYIDNDNEEGLFSPNLEDGIFSPNQEVECRGEDDESMDHGEGDDSQDLRAYRQRIQVLNEDIQSFIMDHGEDEGGATIANPVHNLQVQTECNQIFDDQQQITLNDPSALEFEQVQQIMTPMNHQEGNFQHSFLFQQMNEQIQQLLNQVNYFESQLESQKELIQSQTNQILQVNKEKLILQDIIETKKQDEQLLKDQLSHYQTLTKEQEKQIASYKNKEDEQEEINQHLMQENQILKLKLAQFFSEQKHMSNYSTKEKILTSSPGSQNVVNFRKYQKPSSNAKASPKQQQYTYSEPSLNTSNDKRKSIDASHSGKSLLDRLLQNKTTADKSVFIKQSDISVQQKRMSLYGPKQIATPQKVGKTGSQRLTALMNSGGQKNIPFSSNSGQKHPSKVKESVLLSPKGNDKGLIKSSQHYQ